MSNTLVPLAPPCVGSSVLVVMATTPAPVHATTVMPTKDIPLLSADWWAAPTLLLRWL